MEYLGHEDFEDVFDFNTESIHAFALFKVVDTRGFDLPRTGSNGNWMYPVIGVIVMMGSAAIIFFVVRSKKVH